MLLSIIVGECARFSPEQVNLGLCYEAQLVKRFCKTCCVQLTAKLKKENDYILILHKTGLTLTVSERHEHNKQGIAI